METLPDCTTQGCSCSSSDAATVEKALASLAKSGIVRTRSPLTSSTHPSDPRGSWEARLLGWQEATFEPGPDSPVAYGHTLAEAICRLAHAVERDLEK